MAPSWSVECFWCSHISFHPLITQFWPNSLSILPAPDPRLREKSHASYEYVAVLVRVIEIQENLATTLGIFDRFFDLGRFVCCGDWQI